MATKMRFSDCLKKWQFGDLRKRGFVIFNQLLQGRKEGDKIPLTVSQRVARIKMLQVVFEKLTKAICERFDLEKKKQ